MQKNGAFSLKKQKTSQ